MRHLPVRLKQVRTDQCFRQRLGLQWTPAPAKVRQVTVSPACRPIDPISTGRLTWAPRTGAISGQPHGRTGLQSATREEITPAPDSGWLPGPQETRADRKRPPPPLPRLRAVVWAFQETSSMAERWERSLPSYSLLASGDDKIKKGSGRFSPRPIRG